MSIIRYSILASSSTPNMLAARTLLENMDIMAEILTLFPDDMSPENWLFSSAFPDFSILSAFPDFSILSAFSILSVFPGFSILSDFSTFSIISAFSVLLALKLLLVPYFALILPISSSINSCEDSRELNLAWPTSCIILNLYILKLSWKFPYFLIPGSRKMVLPEIMGFTEPVMV
ncbi:hypothetical protein DSECCO2_595710 [anaerobic digester metagenome]